MNRFFSFQVDDDQCTQTEMAEWPPVSTPTSPLDLSMKSKTFKFVHPPTPEQTMMQSPMACLAKIDANKINMPQLFESLLPKPEIVIQPKTEWHYRNIRDLANKHIPLLSGDGPQRTPIRIRVCVYYFIRNLKEKGSCFDNRSRCRNYLM